MTQQRCARCILPREYPGVHFDEQQCCNFCREEPPPTRLLGIDKLREIIAKHRPPSSEYDCAVALSGGRDSTFVLYHVARVLGLRPLAYTLDHGMLPDHTMENIRNTVRILEVPHVMVPSGMLRKWARPMLRAWLKNPSGRTTTLLCLGCRQEMGASFIDVAVRHNTPIVLNGSGEGGGGDYFALRLFTNQTKGWRRHLDVMAGFGLEFLRNPAFLAHPTALWCMFQEYASVALGIRQRRRPPGLKMISLFEFIPWDEQLIVDTIQRELGWRGSPDADATWRSDCNMAMLKYQFYSMTLGHTPHDAMIAEFVRHGRMTREQGMARLAKDNRINEGFVRRLLDNAGVSAPERFWRKIAQAAKAQPVSCAPGGGNLNEPPQAEVSKTESQI